MSIMPVNWFVSAFITGSDERFSLIIILMASGTIDVERTNASLKSDGTCKRSTGRTEAAKKKLKDGL